MPRLSLWAAGTLTGLEVLVRAPPVGGSALTVAVSVTDPWSMSAWVTV